MTYNLDWREYYCCRRFQSQKESTMDDAGADAMRRLTLRPAGQGRACNGPNQPCNRGVWGDPESHRDYSSSSRRYWVWLRCARVVGLVRASAMSMHLVRSDEVTPGWIG